MSLSLRAGHQLRVDRRALMVKSPTWRPAPVATRHRFRRVRRHYRILVRVLFAARVNVRLAGEPVKSKRRASLMSTVTMLAL